MNLLQRTLVASVLFGVAGAAVAARAVELVYVDPVPVPAGLEQAKVVKVIKLALVGRNWTVSKEEPGYIEGTLNLRKHMVKVGISYGRTEVKFKYVDSAEMNYRERDGAEYIHPNYYKWLNNVRSDISTGFVRSGL
jgi:hypothetical protein